MSMRPMAKVKLGGNNYQYVYEESHVHHSVIISLGKQTEKGE